MKRSVLRPTSWPISLKIPLVVAVLMIVIGSLVTERVLIKLSDIQDQSLADLSGTYLDGLSSSVQPHVLRNDIWEVFDTIERSKTRYGGISIISTIVAGTDDRVIAASDPSLFVTGEKVPSTYLDAGIPEHRLEITPERSEVSIYRQVFYQSRLIGNLIVTLDVSHQLEERAEIRLALIATNAILTTILATVGYFVTRRMTRPMQILAEHLDRSEQGILEEIATHDHPGSSAEARAMFASFNSMVRAKKERDHLVVSLHEEEKLAGLGRLAAAMAHEINNPLGGMLTALDTMKRHNNNPEVRETTIGLLERGLKNIGDVVQNSLLAYRRRSDHAKLRGRDLADLRHLLRPQTNRRKQTIDWNVNWSGKLPLDCASVRQIALNLLLNASEAAGQSGKVVFSSGITDKYLEITVENDGKGIPEPLLHCLNAKGTRKAPLKDNVGIGLWVICRLVEELNGQIRAVPQSEGAMVSVTIPFELGDSKHAA